MLGSDRAPPKHDLSLPLQVSELLVFALELIPLEHLWGWIKDKQLANIVPADPDQMVIPPSMSQRCST
jgi:hypothetical protein